MLLLGVVLAVATTSITESAAPAATPLKTIVHVRSSLLCTTLRDNIFHSIEGLRVNDGLITQGHFMLEKMAYDSVSGPQTSVPSGVGRRAQGMPVSHGFEMDHYQLGQLVHAIAANLEKVNSLLGDDKPFTGRSSEDQSLLSSARKALQTVADQQRASLNILSGTSETIALQLLLAKGDGTQGALGPVSIPDANFSLENATMGASSAQTSPTSTGSTGSNAPSTSRSATSTGNPAETSLFANNTFGRLALGAIIQERITQTSEGGVTPVVLPIVDACR